MVKEIYRRYIKIILSTVLILPVTAYIISCAGTKPSGDSSRMSKAASGYEFEKFQDKINEESFVVTAGNPVVAVYKFRLKPGDADVWAEVIYMGFNASSRAAKDDSILAVGIIYTDGKSVGYFIKHSDYIDFKSSRISNDEFVNRIRKKDLSKNDDTAKVE